jgi:hypothetical protein
VTIVFIGFTFKKLQEQETTTLPPSAACPGGMGIAQYERCAFGTWPRRSGDAAVPDLIKK